MNAPSVPTVENPDLYNQLKHRSTEVMCRMFNHFYFDQTGNYCDPDDFNREEWKRLLAGRLPEETHSWLQTHAKLAEENVDRVHATAYLNETYDVHEEKRDPSTLYEMAILIHELDIDDQLDDLVVTARIKQNEMKRTWILDEHLSFSDMIERINSFHKSWNAREDRTKAVLVQQELTGDSILSLQIFAEKGAGVTKEPTFAFRKEGNKEIPNHPKLSVVRYRELKHIRILLKAESNRTLIVFTDDYTQGWTRILNGFFRHVFDIDSFASTIQRQKVTEATDLQQEARESVEQGEEPIRQITKLIENRSEAAIEVVEKSSHGTERKNKLGSILQCIELSGSEIEDDPNLRTEEFRLISRTNLDDVFEQVDIEDSFLQFLDRASDESLALVLNVDGRHIAARKTGPQSVDGSRLGSETQLALSYFFDQEGVV